MEDWVAIVIAVAFMVLGSIVNAKKEKAKKAERAARAAREEEEFRGFEDNYEVEKEEDGDPLQEIWKRVIKPENTPEVVRYEEEYKPEPDIDEEEAFYHHETPETPLPTPFNPVIATQTVSPLSSIAVVETPELEIKEETKDKKGLIKEEIDLRKMIIYSELLKPKFRDF